ncbi:MAG: TetR/AcrR family transcriptional regulator [Candidatus Acidiferrales bacterium]
MAPAAENAIHPGSKAELPSARVRNQRNGPLRRRYLARRLEILRAAGKHFRVHGFAETGMRDIAAAADLSPANLYNYFRGKQEILFFCQDNSLDRMIAALKKARRLRTSIAERLRVVVISHLRCVLDEVEGSAAHLLTSALPAHLQRSLVAKRDRYEGGVRQLISAGIRSGEFTCNDPALAARAMLGAMNWSVRWFNPEGLMTAAEIAEGFADYLIRGLLAKPEGLRNASSPREIQRSVRRFVSRDSNRRASAGSIAGEG